MCFALKLGTRGDSDPPVTDQGDSCSWDVGKGLESSVPSLTSDIQLLPLLFRQGYEAAVDKREED